MLAQTDGYQLAFTVGAALCLLGAVAAAALLRPRREARVAEPVGVVAASSHQSK